MQTERPSPRYSTIDLWQPAEILDAMIEGQFAAVANRRERAAARLERRRPDLLGVVLDPAVGRKMLGELALSGRQGASLGVEHHGAAAGRALIDGEQAGGIGH